MLLLFMDFLPWIARLAYLTDAMRRRAPCR